MKTMGSMRSMTLMTTVRKMQPTVKTDNHEVWRKIYIVHLILKVRY